jgi:RHS repeat-associated protein
VVSDPGTGLPRLAWHWWDIARENLQKLWKFLTGGDPVDLGTGIFTVEKTDLLLPARIPISIRRTYRSDDTRQGFFGIGWNLGIYDSRLTSNGDTLVLTMSDQNTFQFRPNGLGQWTSTESFLLGAVLTQLPGEFSFQIRYKDGIIHTYDRIVGFANTGGLSAITDRNGNTVTITRDSPAPGVFGLITQITEPAGRSYTLTYDGVGRVTSVTDPIARRVLYTYDVEGHLETVTDPAGGVTRYIYDAQHRITSITDPRNIAFLTNEYDPQGRIIRQTQADGGIWQFSYALIGPSLTETRVTDPRGNTTAHRFSSTGQPLSTTDALGQTTIYEYARNTNLLLNSTDPLGRTRRWEYDALGNLTRMVDPAARPRIFTYEPTFNRVTSITDALNQATALEYDAQGNLTAIVDPLTHRTTLGYNSLGQVITTTDPLNNTTSFTYDGVGNLVGIADPLGNTSLRVYDAVSRLTQQIDPRGMPTSFVYDGRSRTTRILDALAGVTRFSYDGNGNLLTVTDARNSTTSHSYDAMDRLQMRTDPVNVTESFEYDGVGNLTRHSDRKGQAATFICDSLNRRTGSVYADSSVSLTIDAVGRLTQATDTVGGTIENAYDVLDRLTAQTSALGTLAYQYDAMGRRTALMVSGQTPVKYTWDSASRVTQIGQGSQIVTLEYDSSGRRVRLTLPNQVSTEYQHDPASRLTALIYRNAAGQLGNVTYTYDRAGNRTGTGGAFARTLLPDSIAVGTYTTANRQIAFGGQVLSYDANGNLTSDSASTYGWDARNRLIAVNGPANATFQYDALGRRTQRTIDSSTTRFQYDFANPIVEVAEGSLMTAMLAGLAPDEYFTRTDLNGVRALLFDGLGSVLALTDGTGAATSDYTYEPFGRTVVGGGPSANPFQFTGRESDGAGLYFYRTRYYHAHLSRFIGEDPVGLLAGPNVYSYVGNSPLNFTDPLGLDRGGNRGWSFALEAYGGWGGGIVFGKNSNGRNFLTVKVGRGYGGVVAYNPSGASPGYDPSLDVQTSSGLGVYGDAGLGVGPVAFGVSGEAGYNAGFTPESPFVQTYASVTSQRTLEANTRWKLRIGAAVGVQASLVGLDF